MSNKSIHLYYVIFILLDIDEIIYAILATNYYQ